MSITHRRQSFYGLYFLQIIGIVLAWFSGSKLRLEVGGGSALIAIGALCGLLAGFFFLHQLILISGTKLFEKYFGLDRLARIHHVTGLLGYGFVVAHVLFIIFGYSVLSGNGFVDQYFAILDTFEYTLLASIALFLLDMVIITSIFIVRSRLKYELWYFVHLLVYSAVLLALLHQVNNGQNLLANDALRFYWYALYIVAFSLVLWRRWLLPVYYEIKHKFRVEKIVKENDTVTSIYITGKKLEDFSYKAGQFNLWQFWQRGFLSMHHPFTISSSPNDPYIRLSAKAIGDYTSRMDQLKPGTPVLISGPYGLFTQGLASRQKRLFIAGGIGITPILSMLNHEVIDGDILIYAAQTEADAVFADDFKQLEKRGLKTVFVFSHQKKHGAYSGYLTKDILGKEVPMLTDRDIWLCGPPVMMSLTEDILKQLSVPKSQIHTEKFRL